jgi:hypothetical protein
MKKLPTISKECYDILHPEDHPLKNFELHLHGVTQMNTPEHIDFICTSMKLQNCAKAYRKLCDNWSPDWNDTKQHKYFIVYYQDKKDDKMYINYVLSS